MYVCNACTQQHSVTFLNFRQNKLLNNENNNNKNLIMHSVKFLPHSLSWLEAVKEPLQQQQQESHVMCAIVLVVALVVVL